MGCGRKSSRFGKEGLGPNPGFFTFLLYGLNHMLSSSGTGTHSTQSVSSQGWSYEEMCGQKESSPQEAPTSCF